MTSGLDTKRGYRGRSFVGRVLLVGSSGGFAVLVALLTVGGCTITTTTGGFDGGNVAPGAITQGPQAAPTAPATATASCNECLLPSCSAEWAVCAGSSECLALYQCIQQPGIASSPTGYQDCYCAHPSGQAAYRALSYCDSRSECSTCTSSCHPAADTCSGAVTRFDLLCSGGNPDAYQDSAAAPTPPPDAGGQVLDCDACTTASCEAEKTACAISTNCDTYSQCVATAQSADAAAACASDTPDGKTASEALAACTKNNCAAACGL
jgi:hypothetical protein